MISLSSHVVWLMDIIHSTTQSTLIICLNYWLNFKKTSVLFYFNSDVYTWVAKYETIILVNCPQTIKPKSIHVPPQTSLVHKFWQISTSGIFCLLMDKWKRKFQSSGFLCGQHRWLRWVVNFATPDAHNEYSCMA